ncbi:hypothetical protein FJZ31_18225 [Candidatus Poribacteria bacterium]|nr:hypothetical protein [Candidatus Poribacteria bacterium]
MPIIISKNRKNAMRIEKSSFKEEAELQEYISNNLESLLLEEIKENIHFLVLDREFPVSAGNIDVLGVDSEGEVYIIETKLYKNPDKRFVLAQVLDYGASLWSFYEDPDEFIRRIDERLKEREDTGLSEKLESAFGDNKEVIDNIKQSLLNGSFKFIIPMDVVPSTLKSLILFMNQYSQFSIYSVELEYYTHDGYDIFIPHVFGAESERKAVSTSEGKRKKWDEEAFFKDAEKKLDVKTYEAIRKLYEFSDKKADEIAWGTGPLRGSFNPKFHSISIRSVYTVWSDGSLSINFGWLNDNEHTLEWREKLRKELRRITQIANFIPETGDRWPVIPREAWTPIVDEFIIIMTKHSGKE